MALCSDSTSAPSARRPRLALTLGDPAGIGPEVVLKALGDRPWGTTADLTLFGTRSLLDQTLATLPAHQPLPDLGQLNFVEVAPPLPLEPLALGQPSAATGAASFAYLQAAIEGTLAGQYDGIVTAPIAKAAWKAAGHHYPGQTELLAAGAGCDRFAMAFVAQSPYTGWWLRSLLATTHIPLHQVPTALTPALLTQKLDLLIHSLRQDFGLGALRLAVAGLNPHSGEGGQLGREEIDWLVPWLERQRQRHPDVAIDGPVPPDTMWVRPGQAWFGSADGAAAAAHDAYLALYHDQGLIPVKLMAFDRAVNTTVGLPFVRTSPDHGTAFDIAGRGIADAHSMVAAMAVAAAVARQRWAAPAAGVPLPLGLV